MREFQRGQKIRTVSGNVLEIIEKLGQGGQGTVYRVQYNDKQLALKWYFNNRMTNHPNFYSNIQNNINQGSPTSSFLWPLELTEPFEGSFGYLMELRPPEYKEFTYFLLAYERFHSIRAIIEAALSITSSFRVLHAKGFSYQDLNDGNFFVNPITGDVLICDNDNVAPYGENLGIGGKFRYVAPEIVCRLKMPDVHTDRFSLAVILYLLLFFNHPLEGKKTVCPCLTEELEMKIYGLEPVFVWDPNDDSNRPVAGMHDNSIRIWPLYPKFVQKTFIESFSKEALIGKDKQHRVPERRWIEIFIELRNVLMTCSCGEETFIDVNEKYNKCIICGKSISKPLILKVKKFNIVLQDKKHLYACHTIYDSEDFDEIKGSIIRSAMSKDVIGLRNESNDKWDVTFKNGEIKTFTKGEVIKLEANTTINFGNNNIGEIR